MELLLSRRRKVGLPPVSDVVVIDAMDALRLRVRFVSTSATRVGVIGRARSAAAAAAADKEELDAWRLKTVAAAVAALGSAVAEVSGGLGCRCLRDEPNMAGNKWCWGLRASVRWLPRGKYCCHGEGRCSRTCRVYGCKWKESVVDFCELVGWLQVAVCRSLKKIEGTWKLEVGWKTMMTGRRSAELFDPGLG